MLRKCHYTGTNSYQLGLSLGLLPRTLDVIEKNYRGDAGRCLLECLKEWLSQKDNVSSKGGPTWYALVEALCSIEENAVADGIHRESKRMVELGTSILFFYIIEHPACAIFNKHQSQSIQEALPSLAILLHKEGLIGATLLPTSQDMLVALKKAV